MDEIEVVLRRTEETRRAVNQLLEQAEGLFRKREEEFARHGTTPEDFQNYLLSLMTPKQREEALRKADEEVRALRQDLGVDRRTVAMPVSRAALRSKFV